MFRKLREKWKVTGIQLVLILCTFAIGGSLCGYAGRQILSATGMQKGPLYYVLYILLITLLWPVSVLLISFFLGQSKFFRNYLLRVGKRMRLKK